MPFTEDFSAFLDTGEFATAVTVDGNAVDAIFDNDYVAVDLDGVVLESLGPVLLCATADVSTAVQGTAVVVNAVNYTVAEVRPDGTGMTLLRLRAT